MEVSAEQRKEDDLLIHFRDFMSSAEFLYLFRGKSFGDNCTVNRLEDEKIVLNVNGHRARLLQVSVDLLHAVTDIVHDFNDGVGGIEGAKEPFQFRIPEAYLLDLFSLDPYRPDFTVNAIARHYDPSYRPIIREGA